MKDVLKYNLWHSLAILLLVMPGVLLAQDYQNKKDNPNNTKGTKVVSKKNQYNNDVRNDVDKTNKNDQKSTDSKLSGLIGEEYHKELAADSDLKFEKTEEERNKKYQELHEKEAELERIKLGERFDQSKFKKEK